MKIHLDIAQQTDAVEVFRENPIPSNLNAFAAPASVARSLRSSAMSNAASERRRDVHALAAGRDKFPHRYRERVIGFARPSMAV